MKWRGEGGGREGERKERGRGGEGREKVRGRGGGEKVREGEMEGRGEREEKRR